MGRKRIIPLESKALKYVYFIIVNFHGNDVLKTGISNNYIRRFKEYNNSETVGYLKEVLEVYRSSQPKRIETLIKWHMSTITKPYLKQEYYDLRYYGYIESKAKELAHEFGIKMKKIL